jgi:hypothetical protein
MFQITGQHGFHITLANGYTISVQIGRGYYCDNHYSLSSLISAELADFAGPAPPTLTAEIAVIQPNGELMRQEDGDNILKYQTVSDFLSLMNRINAISPIRIVSTPLLLEGPLNE